MIRFTFHSFNNSYQIFVYISTITGAKDIAGIKAEKILVYIELTFLYKEKDFPLDLAIQSN